MKEVFPCAVYTRKSTEDGLEQGFNSLDAQKEACDAYILSQKALGWTLVTTQYDDGGFSGGNIERPAMQRLLADIVAKRIRVIVVYKVDRLTRSLADFAKLVELFDKHGVSFVSVTQQFNTTSSMGRLTLNVLLSFAQFEREVTGERIRDKIAASKRKGMWMGGAVPTGYLPNDRTLTINEPEAERIRELYRLYLELNCVRKLKAEIDRRGWMSPVRTARRGNVSGGLPFSRGNLYSILNNPVYNGQIKHKDLVFPGQHPAIIDPALWQAVQERLQTNRQGKRHRTNAKVPSLLAGLVFDATGQRLAPTHTRKGARRYRYYVELPSAETGQDDQRESDSPPLRWPAQELESAVLNSLVGFLNDRPRLLNLMGTIPAREVKGRLAIAEQQAKQLARTSTTSNPADRIELMLRLVKRIVVHHDHLEIAVHTNVIGSNGEPEIDGEVTMLEVTVELKRRGKAVRLIVHAPGVKEARGPDSNLIGLLAKAHKWFSQLTSGRYDSVNTIADEEGLTRAYVTKVIHLAFLAPDILDQCIEGNQPVALSARRVARMGPLPLDWQEQRKVFGMTD